jgi:hypothetical protein
MNMNTHIATEAASGVRALVDAELDRVSGGLPSVALVFGGFGVAAGDLRGYVTNGIRKALLDTLLGK